MKRINHEEDEGDEEFKFPSLCFLFVLFVPSWFNFFMDQLLLKLKAFGELAQWLALDPASGFYFIKDGDGVQKRMRHAMRIRFEKLGRELGLIEEEKPEASSGNQGAPDAQVAGGA